VDHKRRAERKKTQTLRKFIVAVLLNQIAAGRGRALLVARGHSDDSP